ncbi:hypothetical protein BBJ28_00025606 [Nothophytophthora sp. Chile5]|nr:hypothetical protein BBJ28_00025606 [Nothophytophthora sp. Chile5]
MASSCLQVQLVCLSASLVIASAERPVALSSPDAATPPTSALSADDAVVSADSADSRDGRQKRQLELIPTLLELLFFTPATSDREGQEQRDAYVESDDTGRQRFLSYVETQHEVSLVFEEQLLHKFPVDALEVEPVRWKALQVASAGPGAFLSQLAVLTQLTTELARHKLSVFQISTYQSDYGKHTNNCGLAFQRQRTLTLRCVCAVHVVLVKVEDLEMAIACLQSFCSIEMESGEELHAVLNSNVEQSEGEADIEAPEVEADEQQEADLAVHQHLLSVPDVELHLVQLDRTFVRRHMYSLVQLLFGHRDDGEASTSTSTAHFLSYSETGDDISVVTSDKRFLDEAQTLAAHGDERVLVSPDFWRPVQIGSAKLGFSETGIVAGQTRVLVNAGTTVFYLSTYATDFMLIKEDEWADALPILRSHFRVIEGSFAPLTE